MRKGKKMSFDFNEAVEFLNHLLLEMPHLPFIVPLILVCWAIEKWIFSLSNWVPLVVCFWATNQYWSYKHHILVEHLNRKWKQVIQHNSPITPLEHCEWLNKFLMEIWPHYINPKLSMEFSSIFEKRLKHKKSRLIESIELLEFSLGSCAPCLGLHGTRWSTSGDQRILHFGFDWDSTDINIMLRAKLAKPLIGTARIVINTIHIKGEILLMPVLEGKALLYSFLSSPEVRIDFAHGSGGSQLPGVSTWLGKLLSDYLAKTMVEPRRRCFPLSSADSRKEAVGALIHVTVVSANKLSRSNLKGSPYRRLHNLMIDGRSEDCLDNKDLKTFVEVKLEGLTRRTSVRSGSSPKWDSTFNMVLHSNTGILKFHLFECTSGSVKCDYLTACEIKMRYVKDDSTIFWAIGPEFSVIAKHEFCAKEVEMAVPFEGVHSGELIVRLVLKEWQHSHGSLSSNSTDISFQQSLYASSNFLPRTGRKIFVSIAEGKDLMVKDKFGKSDPYVKLQYGKVLQRTISVPHTSNPSWNQRFEFDEIGGDEHLLIKCYNEEPFGDDIIGSAKVNLQCLEGSMRDVWVPLEKASSGELRLQIEAVRIDDSEGSRGSNISSSNGWIELVLVEAKDLVAADLGGTSDPYITLQYGNMKRRTKVLYKTLNPQWHQTFEFPDDGSPLELHVKDHNAVLPTSSIGDCIIEYHGLPPNRKADKWIPLQGVKRGEVHIQLTRKVPRLEKRSSSDSESSTNKAQVISYEVKQMMMKFRSLIADGNLDGSPAYLSELQSLQDMQEEYTVQLETEQMLLLNKIDELRQESLNSWPTPSGRSSH